MKPQGDLRMKMKKYETRYDDPNYDPRWLMHPVEEEVMWDAFEELMQRKKALQKKVNVRSGHSNNYEPSM